MFSINIIRNQCFEINFQKRCDKKKTKFRQFQKANNFKKNQQHFVTFQT